MDLGSMLNSADAPTNMDQEAVSLYRRLSNSSASASPAQSPSLAKQTLQRENSDSFRTPELPASVKDRSTPPLKRKFEQVDGSAASDTEKSPSISRSTKDGSPVEQKTAIEKSPLATKQALPKASESVGSTQPSAIPQKSDAKPSTRCAYDGRLLANEFLSVIKRQLLQSLAYDVYGRNGVEIEARLGIIRDARSGRRVAEISPVISTQILKVEYGKNKPSDIRFESNMSSDQHAKFNQHLNAQVELQNPKRKDYDPSRPKMTYVHTRQTDKFYKNTGKSDLAENVRVTTDDKTGAVVESILKDTSMKLHVVCPGRPFDIRLSVNLEEPAPTPVAQTPSFERRKDRLSYAVQGHQIDLTKVDGQGKTNYELEIEMKEMKNVKRQADLEAMSQPNTFEDILASFLGSVMHLNEVAAKF